MMVPSRAVLKKFALSTMVVKFSAPAGRCAMHPKPKAVSAKATTVAACRNPLAATKSRRMSSSAVSRPSSIAMTRNP